MAATEELMSQAWQCFQARQLEEAEQRYRQVLEIDSTHSDAWYLLGRVLAALKKPEEAVASYSKAVQFQPDHADACNYLGAALANQGKLEEAAACFKQALAVEDRQAHVHNNLGKVLYFQGKLDEAVDCFRRALELQPSYEDARNNLSSVLSEMGRPAEAAALSENRGPDRSSPTQTDGVSTILTPIMQQLLALQQEQFLRQLLSASRYADPKCLSRYEFSVFSQTGEDGIIAEVFRRIGVTDRFFVEVGVGAGLENNTTYLLRQGWRGCWVDSSQKNAALIGRNFNVQLASGQLVFLRALVTAENIEQSLGAMAVPKQFDLLSLDIDRNTFWVWKSMRTYRPRAVVIEYNASVPPPVEWAVEYRPDLNWNGTDYYGASLKSFELLGRNLGYSLVGCNICGFNAFFVRTDLCKDRFLEPFTAERHYEPARFFLYPRWGVSHGKCFTDLD
jgi:Flp pilus assembly protein TadD